MVAASGSPWPALEAGYEDEFGPIDGRVYDTAGRLCSRAERLAQRVLGDPQRGRTLLLQASAAVTAAASDDTAVRSLDAYLMTAFRRLVMAEGRRTAHQRSLAVTHLASTPPDPTPELDRRVLLGELEARMDPWTKEVARLLLDGGTFRQIAVAIGSDASWVRRRFALRMARLLRTRTSPRAGSRARVANSAPARTCRYPASCPGR